MINISSFLMFKNILRALLIIVIVISLMRILGQNAFAQTCPDGGACPIGSSRSFQVETGCHWVDIAGGGRYCADDVSSSVMFCANLGGQCAAEHPDRHCDDGTCTLINDGFVTTSCCSGGGSCGSCSAAGCDGKDVGDACNGGTCQQHAADTCSGGKPQCGCVQGSGGNSTDYTQMYVYVKAPVGPGGSLVNVRTAGGDAWWSESGACLVVPVIGVGSEVLTFAINEGDPQYCQDQESGSCNNWDSYPMEIIYNRKYDDAITNFGCDTSTSPYRVYNWIRRIEARGTFGFDVVRIPTGFEVDHVERTDGSWCGYELRGLGEENHEECSLNGDDWCWICQGNGTNTVRITIILKRKTYPCARCSTVNGCEWVEYDSYNADCSTIDSAVTSTTNCATCNSVSGGNNTRCNSCPRASCSITGPPSLYVGGANGTFSTTGAIPGSVAWRTSINYISTAITTPWALACQGTSSCSWTGNPCTAAGQSFYFTCNSYDNVGQVCSGNPYCEWPPLPSYFNCGSTGNGWYDCGASDLMTLSCLSPPLTPPVTPTLPPTVTPSCPGPPAGLTPSGDITCNTTQVTLRWNADPLATGGYAVRFHDQASAWQSCAGSDETCVDTQNNFLTVSVIPGHRYEWWVHSVSSACGWSQPTYAYFYDPTCGLPSCTISIPASLSINNGGTIFAVSPSITEMNGTVLNVRYTVGSSAVASVCDSSLASCPVQSTFTSAVSPYGFKITGNAVSPPTTILTATATMDDGITTCSASSVVTVNGCVVRVNPIDIPKDSTHTYTPWIINQTGGTNRITSMEFSLPGTTIAAVCSSSSAPPCTSNSYTDNDGSGVGFDFSLTGVNVGSTILSTRCTMSSIAYTSPWFTSAVSVREAPWWQASGGNVVSKGSVTSTIPSTAYDLNFIKNPIALLIYNYSLPPSLGSGRISGSEISANTLITLHPEASFNLYFDTKLPGNIRDVITDNSTVSPSNLSNTYDTNSIPFSNLSSCAAFRGYRICYYDGSYDPGTGELSELTLTGNYIIPDGVRIILFVDNADVTLGGSIKPATRGKSSFLLISEGGIIVDEAVGGPFNSGTTPDLEGVFYTNGGFETGHNTAANDSVLHIRGSVVAANFSLGRNLGIGGGETNDSYPSEFFEYGTEQVLAFPPFLRLRSTYWSEAMP